MMAIIKQHMIKSSRNLLFLILVALLLLGGGGIYRLVKIHAAPPPPPPDVNWYLDRGVGSYNAMIAAIRKNVSAKTVYDQTNETGSSVQRFFINIWLNSTDPEPTVRMLMRTNDLYIEGWQSGSYGAFTYFNDVNPPIPPSAFASGITPYSSQYGVLQTISGKTRLGMSMGLPSFRNTVQNLGGIIYTNIHVNTNTADSARDILQLAQAISEASRIKYIAQQIANNYNGAWPVDIEAINLENDWSAMSKNMELGMQTGIVPALTVVPAGTPGYPVAGVVVTTLAGYAALLAIALLILL